MTTRPKNAKPAIDLDDQDEDISFDGTVVAQTSALDETFSERTVVMPRSQMPDYIPPVPSAAPAPPKAAEKLAEKVQAPSSAKPISQPLARPVSAPTPAPPPQPQPPPVSRAAKPPVPEPKAFSDEVTMPGIPTAAPAAAPSWANIPLPPVAEAKLPPKPAFSPTQAGPTPKPITSPTARVAAQAKPMTSEIKKPTTGGFDRPIAPLDDLDADPPAPPEGEASPLVQSPVRPPNSGWSSAQPISQPVEKMTPKTTGSIKAQYAADAVSAEPLEESERMELTNFDHLEVKKKSPLEKFKALPRPMQLAAAAGLVLIVILLFKMTGSSHQPEAKVVRAEEPAAPVAAPAAPAPEPPKPQPVGAEAVLTQFDQAFFKTQGQAGGN